MFENRRMWRVGLAMALVLGAALRLIWVTDIEYKGDEAWIFDQTQRAGRTGQFPWLGMPSSIVVPSPGMSIWVFVVLSRIFAAHDAPALARGVQILNIAAIGLLVVLAFRAIPTEEREPWLWAAALVSLNPLAVLLQRKIWPPSVLPLFTLLALLGWWSRHLRWGAFTWGLVGACLGQIHVSGFFFAAGCVAWTMLFDRRSVAWPSWLIGSGLGALGLIPWLQHIWTTFGSWPAGAFKWTRLFGGRFWIRWVTEPFGWSLHYSLGPHFNDFLRYPLINGRSTYLVLVLHVAIISAAMVILSRAGYQLWRERDRWGDLWIGRGSRTAFTVNAALWGFGILLTASGLSIHRHYMLAAVPLQFVWLARVALSRSGNPCGTLMRPRALLAGLCLVQCLLSATFLGYIHVNGGAIHGDYGVAYGEQ